MLTLFTNSTMGRLQAGLMGLGMLLLAGCSNSISFIHPPAASFHVPLPAEINGMWAFEGKDRGERIRVTGLQDGSVRFSFIQVQPSNGALPVESFLAQTLRFDNADWLLLDWRKLSTAFGDKDKGQGAYKLVRFVLDNPDRLCGIEMTARIDLFVEAIAAGQLEGTVLTNTAILKSTHVTVTSAGPDWVKWWGALPESRKIMMPLEFCFRRVS